MQHVALDTLLPVATMVFVQKIFVGSSVNTATTREQFLGGIR